MREAERTDPPPIIPLYVSPAEAAALLGLSRQMVYQLLDAGRIKSTRHGARRLVDRDSLHAYAESLAQRGA